jgi:hypothetical protein
VRRLDGTGLVPVMLILCPLKLLSFFEINKI